MKPRSLRFCSYCGADLEDRTPDGDDRVRKVCGACDSVHYQNPLMVVGCLVERGDEILLCRRAIEPACGRWTTPAGYLELGEGLLAGARRETLEEAGVDVDIVAPHAFLDLPHIGQAYALFRAVPRSPAIRAGTESLEVAFVHPGDIPWDELAFPAVHFALRLLLEDRGRAVAHVHSAVVAWSGAGARFDPRSYTLCDHLRRPLA